MQAESAAADEAGRRTNALLAASQASSQLKASQVQEQQIVAAFLHHLCEQVWSWAGCVSLSNSRRHVMGGDAV
jgi:hypothetical protein